MSALAPVADANAVEPVSRQIVDLANELVGRIWGHFTARAAELNLSIPEAKALSNLEADQAMPMRALAARLHANPSNVTVIVARLEARGLLERQVSDDRRVKGVRLTPADSRCAANSRRASSPTTPPCAG